MDEEYLHPTIFKKLIVAPSHCIRYFVTLQRGWQEHDWKEIHGYPLFVPALQKPYTLEGRLQSQLDSALFLRGHRHQYVSTLYHILSRMPKFPRVYHHPVAHEKPLRSFCRTSPPGEPNHHVTYKVHALSAGPSSSSLHMHY